MEETVMISLNAAALLPEDGETGALAGRVWLPAASGPSVVAIRRDGVYDITAQYPTISSLAAKPDPAACLRDAKGISLGSLDEIAANTPPDRRDRSRPWLLAPIDLGVIKAAGVTFAVS